LGEPELPEERLGAGLLEPEGRDGDDGLVSLPRDTAGAGRLDSGRTCGLRVGCSFGLFRVLGISFLAGLEISGWSFLGRLFEGFVFGDAVELVNTSEMVCFLVGAIPLFDKDFGRR